MSAPSLTERHLGWSVRGALVGIAIGLGIVFGVALRLEPYARDGAPLRMETHRQLGLPPCTFYALTGIPCPSCGMTTSFALFVRGDLVNSLRANAAGTVLAVVCLALIPWSLASAARGRPLLFRSLERVCTRMLAGFVLLMLIRWFVVLAFGFHRPY